jgi:hypothetical protein
VKILRSLGLMGPRQHQHPPPPRDAKLTDDQKVKASEIASRYDAEAMTHDDQRAMRHAFDEAGVRPGTDLHEILDKAGFKPRGPVGRGAGPERPDSDARVHTHRAREPRPAPKFVVDFRSKQAQGATDSRDFAAFADRLRVGGRSLRGNLIDDMA